MEKNPLQQNKSDGRWHKQGRKAGAGQAGEAAGRRSGSGRWDYLAGGLGDKMYPL